jgi:hypothetical protein
LSRPGPRMAPHEKLLTACAVSALSEEAVSRVETALAAPNIDWPAFVRDSIRHGLAQHAALHLTRPEHATIPAEVRRCLARMREGNRRRNDVHFREAARLVEAFRYQGIHSIVLKGVALALNAYPDPSLRNFADIDVLVPEEEFAAALRVAAEIGYASARRELEPLSHEETLLYHCSEDVLSDTLAPEFDANHAPDRVRPYSRRLVLEVHRGLFRDASGLWRHTDIESFWQRPQTIPLHGDTTCRALSPEAMIVHLAGHAADHGFSRLIFLLDIATHVARFGPQIDWDRVHQLAEFVQIRGHVARTLAAVRLLPGADLPTAAYRTGIRHYPITLADVFASGHDTRKEGTLRRWMSEENWTRRAVAAWRLVAPPPATIRRVYGVRSPIAVAAIYLYRPFQLAGRLTTILVRRARRALKGA